KIMGVEIYPPNIVDLKPRFYTDGETITYGLSNVRDIGESSAIELISFIKDVETQIGKPIKKWSWYEFLILAANKAGKTTMERLIATGAFRDMDIMRSKAMKEYEAFSEINKNEQKWVKENYQKFDNLTDLM